MGSSGKVDGCAIFFLAHRFELKQSLALEFNAVALAMYGLQR